MAFKGLTRPRYREMLLALDLQAEHDRIYAEAKSQGRSETAAWVRAQRAMEKVAKARGQLAKFSPLTAGLASQKTLAQAKVRDVKKENEAGFASIRTRRGNAGQVVDWVFENLPLYVSGEVLDWVNCPGPGAYWYMIELTKSKSMMGDFYKTVYTKRIPSRQIQEGAGFGDEFGEEPARILAGLQHGLVAEEE